jgi:GNAT superfamily N-acetyltransferase
VDHAAAVQDCVRLHVAWLTSKARSGGGWVRQDGPQTWAWVPAERTLHGLFPDVISPGVAGAGIRAESPPACSICVWSATDVPRPELLAAGFEEGWQPWWMCAPTDDFPVTSGTRVRLTSTTAPDDGGSSGLLTQPNTWRAEARVEGAYAGRAWLHLDGDVAGLFDMEVWPRFRRLGLGSELLGLLVGTARDHGAERVVLNATPEGALLYAAAGFSRVGEGRTWWRHRPWWRRSVRFRRPGHAAS